MIASDSRFRASIEKHSALSLFMGVIASVIGYIARESGYSSRGILFSLLRAFNSWFWLIAILGFGSRYLTFNNQMLKYANVGVLPFYILHQTVIVTIGFYIADWKTGVLLKYLILSTSSFIVIMALYDLIIKRIKLLRFLFGMKTK